MQPLQVRNQGVHLDDDSLGGLQDLGRGTDGGTRDDVAFLCDGGGLDDGPVQGLLRIAVLFVEAVVPVDEVLWEH